MNSSMQYDNQITDTLVGVIDTQAPKTLVVDGFKDTLTKFNPQSDYLFSAATVAKPLDIEAVFQEGERVGNILKQGMTEKELEEWLYS